MRNLTCFFLGVLFIFCMIECDNSTESDEDSIIGKWYPYKYYDAYFDGEELETGEEIYDPDLDNFYDATIYEITKDKFIVYYNEPGTNYNQDIMEYELISNDSILIDGEDTLEYSFEDGMLVFSQKWEEDDEYQIFKIYLKKYKGDIPPASWKTALKNDDYEPDNNYQDATSITIGATAQKHIIVTDDEDWFKFQANSTKTYMIKVSSYMDNVLTLYDQDGQSEIAEDDDNDWDIDVSGNVESVLVWDCDSSGTYYFKVTGYDEEEEGYYSIDVNLTNIESPLSKLGKGPVINKDHRTRLFQATRR